MLDAILAAVLLASILLAAAQGFAFELFSVAGAVFGYLLAAWEYPVLVPRFVRYTNSVSVAEMASFLTIFFVVVIGAGIAGRIARWILKEAGLRWADRLLGAAFGLLRGVLIGAVIVLATMAFSPDARAVQESYLGPYLLVGARGIVLAAPAGLRQKLRDGIAAVRRQNYRSADQSTAKEPTSSQ
jgi:membrane protein required for colicin V production